MHLVTTAEFLDLLDAEPAGTRTAWSMRPRLLRMLSWLRS